MNLANLLTSTQIQNKLDSLLSEQSSICLRMESILKANNDNCGCYTCEVYDRIYGHTTEAEINEYDTEELAALSSRLDVIMMEIRDISESLALNYENN